MTHAELVTMVGSAHTVAMLAAWGAFHKYGDTHQTVRSSRESASRTIRHLKQRVSEELGKRIESLFAEAGSVPSPILEPDANTYIERPVNPIPSERYRQLLSDFISDSSSHLVSLSYLSRCRESWHCWQHRRSWTTLALGVWQGIALALVGVLDKACAVTLPDWIVISTLAPLGIAVIVFALCSAVILVYDHKIQRIQEDTDGAVE
jgi:hypothetical protein